MEDIFNNVDMEELDLTEFSTRGVSQYRQFLYEVDDRVIIRDDIRVGTISGGVEFTVDHKVALEHMQTLGIKDCIEDEYGNYYEVHGLDGVVITDSMVDQIKTKELQKWLVEFEELCDQPLKLIIGRTASGKDTFAKQFTDKGELMVRSYTTRPRREGEGDTHRFIDSTEGYSPQWVKSTINGYEYFVLPRNLEDKDVFIVDPVGFHSLMQQEEFIRDIEVYYLMVDPETRIERYVSRDTVDILDFCQRDASEDEQFTEFEEMLQDPKFRHMYNIRVFTSETRDGEPLHRELYFDKPYCEYSHTGGWVIRRDKTDPIEIANDYIESLLSR